MSALSVLVSTLLISCATAPEMSAEEEQMSGGATAATETSSGAPEELALMEPAASTESAATEEDAAEETDSSSEEAQASNESNESEEAPEVAAAPTASKEIASFDPGIPSDASTETPAEEPPSALPLSGEMASKEVATVDSRLIEPTLVMPSMNEPSLVVPSKNKMKKSRVAKKTTQVSENEVVNTPAPVVEVAPEVKAPASQVEASATTQTAAADKGGVKMNRYYFLRPGDHTEKVSELLYGNRNMADKLLTWNNGIENWVPGNMIWYNSPVLSNDSTARSFYEETNTALKEHKVVKGENLKVLAARFYGDIRCYTELAHINHLGKDASNVGAGTVLKFAPEKFATAVQANAGEVAKPADVVEEEDPFAVADSNNKQRETAEVKKDKKSLASADLGSFIKNNLFLIITVTIALGLIVFMMKRKEKDPMEF